MAGQKEKKERVPKILESVIQRKVMECARKYGAYVIRLRGTNEAGLPDLIILYHSKTFFIEVKRSGEKPTALQAFKHETLNNHGFRTYVMNELNFKEKMQDAIIAHS